MTSVELSLSILALLVTPGPTNTLVAVAGAERGAIRAMRLVPAELAGYLTVVVPLAYAGAPLLADQPALHAALGFAAGLWVAVLALRLWRLPQTAKQEPTVNARTLFLTTVMNPKALVFGLVLLPDPVNTTVNLANFTCQVVAVAALWAVVGARLGRSQGKPAAGLPILRRAASLWLSGLAVVLILRSAGLA